MPRRGSSKPPAEPVVKPYGCDFIYKALAITISKGFDRLKIYRKSKNEKK